MTQDERNAELAHKNSLLEDECKKWRNLVEQERKDRRDQKKHYIMLAVIFTVSYLCCHLLLNLFRAIIP